MCERSFMILLELSSTFAYTNIDCHYSVVKTTSRIMEVVTHLKAIAEPTRLRILNLILARGPEMCVCDLVSVLKLPQSTISRHLMTLRHLGLLSTRRDGLWINYSLARGQRAVPTGSFLALIGACCSSETICKDDLKRYDKLIKENAIVRCQKTTIRRQTSGSRR